jgi:tetratricopeptide (TPR) repeat protein
MDRAQALREEMVRLRRKIHGNEHPQTLGALTALADGYVAANRTRQALPHWKMITDSTPAETSIALKLTLLHAWYKQSDEFTAASRHLLRRATAETNALRLARFATAINLLPSPDRAQAESNLALAKKALALNLDPSRSAAYRLAVGMSEYRMQQFTAAVSTLEAIAKEFQTTSPNTLTAGLFQCMSLVQLGRKDEARSLFQSLQSKLRPLPMDPENPLREGVREEDLTAWIASKEAASLLELSGRRTP